MALFLVGLVAGYWGGFWFGYLNRESVKVYLKTGKFPK